jgi:ATP-binding cassette subfamily G (WHITE) protein 2 (SNQ2)
MAELGSLFAQRPIVLRHQKAAMYYPFIESLAHTVVDVPITLVIQTVFAVLFYILVGLQQSAAQFLCVPFCLLYITGKRFCSRLNGSTFLLFVLTVTLVMKAFFRSIAASFRAEASAVSLAGFTVMLLFLYTGYTIPRPSIVGALRWITYLNVRAMLGSYFDCILTVFLSFYLFYSLFHLASPICFRILAR